MAKSDQRDGWRDTDPRGRVITGEHATQSPQPAVSVLLGLLKSAVTAIVFEAARSDHEDVSGVAARRGIRKITSTAHRMDRLVADLTDLFDVESGKLKLERRRIDFARMVFHVTNALPPDKRKLMRFEVREHVIISADADRLERVVATLIDNALNRVVDAEVAVRIDRRADHAVLTIADHGPGLTGDQLKCAFGPRSPDSGMPLYVARKLVELHGGKMSVDSVPSRGAAFAVELPALPSTERQPIIRT
jgi:signal transduction histidine kinase